jgi:hypothetical protein
MCIHTYTHTHTHTHTYLSCRCGILGHNISSCTSARPGVTNIFGPKISSFTTVNRAAKSQAQELVSRDTSSRKTCDVTRGIRDSSSCKIQAAKCPDCQAWFGSVRAMRIHQNRSRVCGQGSGQVPGSGGGGSGGGGVGYVTQGGREGGKEGAGGGAFAREAAGTCVPGCG